MQPIIHLRDIRKSYYMGKQAIPVLKGIDLDIQKGEYVALMLTCGKLCGTFSGVSQH